MDSTDFEGYTGLYLNNNIFSNDLMLVIVFVLLSAFACLFRLNVFLFSKIITNINTSEQRQSIFETTEKDSFGFTGFLIFQTILLFSIFTFSAGVKYNCISYSDTRSTFLSLGLLFIIFFFYYLCKRLLYAVFGAFFIEKPAFKMMFTNYHALLCLFGVSLYIPVFWILLFDARPIFPFIFLIFSYIAFKAMLSYRFICIFYNKNTGFIFLNLYLCAQEIVPLVFLYEGMVYMYNILK